MSEETPQFEIYAESHEYPYDHVSLAIKDGGEIFHTDLSSYLSDEREKIYNLFAALVHRANTQPALLDEYKQLLFLWWENLPKCDKPDCFRCKANSIKKKEFEAAIALAEKGLTV